MNKLFLILFIISTIVYSYDTLTVVKVKDGDTYLLSNGKIVRLIGIDTPEKFKSVKLKKDVKKYNINTNIMKSMGELSSIYAQKNIEGKRVALYYGRDTIDYYGRTLAYIYIIGDSISFNARIIKDGYSKTFRKYSFNQKKSFIEYQLKAEKENKGLWKTHKKYMKSFCFD
jgi:micrococcal nuclease